MTAHGMARDPFLRPQSHAPSSAPPAIHAAHPGCWLSLWSEILDAVPHTMYSIPCALSGIFDASALTGAPVSCTVSSSEIHAPPRSASLRAQVRVARGAAEGFGHGNVVDSEWPSKAAFSPGEGRHGGHRARGAGKDRARHVVGTTRGVGARVGTGTGSGTERRVAEAGRTGRQG